ncbi:MAG: choice-of-anchor J domain-containing protein [Aquaticitalea sp.]
MKKIYLLLIALTITSFGFGQTPIISQDLKTGSLPTGWTQTSVTFSTSAGGYANFTATSATLTTPVFNASAYTSLRVDTSVAKFGTGTDGPITIEYSLNGGTTWTTAGTTSTPSGSNYLDDQLPISSVSSTMRIRFNRSASLSQKRFRDVVINGVGTVAACTPPTDQATAYNTTGISTTTATPRWTSGTGANVLVVMRQGGAVNADPVNGTSYTGNTVFGVAPTSQIGTGNYVVYSGPTTDFVNVTGLTQNTNYHVAVYQYATTGTCYNLTELTGNFNTLCTAVYPVAFSEDFEGGVVPPTCWTTFRGTNNAGVVEDWKIDNTGLGVFGSASARVDTENVVAVAEDWLVTPAIDLSATTNNELKFYARDISGTDFGTIYSVKASTTSQTDRTSFTFDLGSYTETELTTLLDQKTLSLSALGTNTVYIAFIMTTPIGGGDSFILDEVTVTGDCVSPTVQASAFTATNINAATGTATLNWTGGNGDNVLVVARAGGAVDADPTSGITYTADTSFGDGDEIGTGNFVVYNGPADTVNLNSLLDNTTYHVAIYEYNNTAVCYNETELTGTFYVPCTASILPFTEGFEGMTIPTCWTVFDNGVGTGVSWAVNSNDANTGSYSAFLEFQNFGSGNSEDWLVSAPIDLAAITNGELTFFTKDGDADEYGSNYTVRISTASQTTPGDFTTVATYIEDPTAPNYIGSTYNQKTIDLSAYANQTIYIAFVMDQDLSVDGDQWYLDDIKVVSPVVAGWQIPMANQLYTIDFENTVANVNNGAYNGSGFTTIPSTGQLNSDAWATTGMSDGDSNFGDLETTGDFARGTSLGGVSTGGFYSFNTGGGNLTFGVQPTGSDYIPGSTTLRAQNQTGETVTSITFAYTVYVNNNENRSNTFNFAYSDDNSTFVNVPSLDITSGLTGNSTGFVANVRTITINALNIADGEFIYLQWNTTNPGGSGSMDEFGLDDISVIFNPLVTDNNSNIVETGFDVPDNIDYVAFNATSGLTTANAIKIGEFSIQDGGDTLTDTDNVSTILTDLSFDIQNFGDIAALAIFDGTTNVSEVTTVTATTAFSGLTLEAADDSAKVFSVYATFNTTVTDNNQLQLTISAATASLTGSGFAAADAGAATTSVAGDDNRIEVTATGLSFVQQPSDSAVGAAMTPAVTVSASDVNSNSDVDFVGSINISSTGNFAGSATLTATAVAGVASFDNLVFVSSGTFTLTATSAGLIDSDPSDPFVIYPATKAFWYEPFTDNSQYDVTVGGEGNNGNSDYFQITNGSNIDKSYSGNIGNFFAAQDIDDGGWTDSASPSQLTWTGINISSYTSLTFSGKFASTAATEIDAADFVLVEYRLDGGGWTKLIAFENDGTSSNTFFLEDTNFDGTGDGTQLTSTFQNFSKPLAFTGNTLDLRITVALDSGDEDIALEDFKLEGVGTVFYGNDETGFGGVVGDSTLEVDMASGTTIDFTFTKGADEFNDYMVIYIDSEAGGIENTSGLTDTADQGRKAVSGFAGGTNRSQINFPAGFRPEYAISLNSGFANLFKINGGNHTSLGSANLSPIGDPNAATYTFNINFADINATPGEESFKFLATYLNGDNAFRSNESIGRNSAGASNPGYAAFEMETYYQVSSGLQGGKAPTQAIGIWTGDSTWLNGNPPLDTDEITINNNVIQNIDVTAIDGIIINATLFNLPNYTLSTSGGIIGSGALNVSGTFSIAEGGFTNIVPTYDGSTVSTLEYKDIPGTYNRFNEWTPGVTVGSGVPNNVIIDNTVLDLSALGGAANVVALNVGTDISLINNATLNIDGAKSLTIGNAMNNTEGTVNMGSTSVIYSSLIADSVTGLGTFNYTRHINGQPGVGVGAGANDLVSAPFSGQTFGDFAAANSNLTSNPANVNQKRFGPFSKTTGTYVNWDTTVEGGTPLAAGVGYRASTSDNAGITFTGTANTGIVTNDILNAGPQFASYNLIGNPYPSYINVREFLEHEVSSGVRNIDLMLNPLRAIYGYDGDAAGNSGDGWIIYNLNTALDVNLAPGQGFLVTADPSNVAPYDIEFAPTMRRTDSTDDFIPGRYATENNAHLRLQAAIQTSVYKTDFYFNDNSTSGLDAGYDAGVFGSNAASKSIYSHLVADNVGVDMAIQSLAYSALGSDIIVPLGINVPQGQQVTVSIAESNLSANIEVYLEDVSNNTFTLLNTTDYVFTATSNLTDTGRFYLRFTDNTLSTDDSDLDKLQIYALDQTIFVNGMLNDATNVSLFDIQGRNVLSTKLESGSTNNTIDVSHMSTGVYIVKLSNTTQQKTQRVIIK